MNKVILLGRITAKPEIRYTGSNVPYVRFTVAVNRQFNNQDGTRDADFINIIAWRKQAEVICNYFDKGNQIAIEGRLQTGSYDGQDGNKRYTMDVVADSVQFLESRAQSQSRGQSNSNEPSPYDYQNDSTNNLNVDNDPFADFGDSVSIDDNFLD